MRTDDMEGKREKNSHGACSIMGSKRNENTTAGLRMKIKM
jgi:hypothetical protein